MRSLLHLVPLELRHQIPFDHFFQGDRPLRDQRQNGMQFLQARNSRILLRVIGGEFLSRKHSDGEVLRPLIDKYSSLQPFLITGDPGAVHSDGRGHQGLIPRVRQFVLLNCPGKIT